MDMYFDLTMLLLVVFASCVGVQRNRWQSVMMVVRAAVERGREIDPGIVDRLMGRHTSTRDGVMMLVREALEHGRELDPAIIEQLMNGGGHRNCAPWGIVTIATGVGTALATIPLVRVWPGAVYPALGAAIFVVCVGIGLMIAARFASVDAAKCRVPAGDTKGRAS